MEGRCNMHDEVILYFSVIGFGRLETPGKMSPDEKSLEF